MMIPLRSEAMARYRADAAECAAQSVLSPSPAHASTLKLLALTIEKTAVLVELLAALDHELTKGYTAVWEPIGYGYQVTCPDGEAVFVKPSDLGLTMAEMKAWRDRRVSPDVWARRAALVVAMRDTARA